MIVNNILNLIILVIQRIENKNFDNISTEQKNLSTLNQNNTTLENVDFKLRNYSNNYNDEQNFNQCYAEHDINNSTNNIQE